MSSIIFLLHLSNRSLANLDLRVILHLSFGLEVQKAKGALVVGSISLHSWTTAAAPQSSAYFPLRAQTHGKDRNVFRFRQRLTPFFLCRARDASPSPTGSFRLFMREMYDSSAHQGCAVALLDRNRLFRTPPIDGIRHLMHRYRLFLAISTHVAARSSDTSSRNAR